MKGVLFNVVEEVVTELYSADTWDDLLAAAEVEGSYTSLGSYPDEEMLAIVGAAAEALGLPVPALLRTVGHHAFKGLTSRYPDFTNEGSLRDFLQHVENIIHPEVKMLYPDAVLPTFTFEDMEGDRMRMVYTSPRGLDHLAEGLIGGAAEAFGEEVTIERPEVAVGPQSTAFDLVFN